MLLTEKQVLLFVGFWRNFKFNFLTCFLSRAGCVRAVPCLGAPLLSTSWCDGSDVTHHGLFPCFCPLIWSLRSLWALKCITGVGSEPCFAVAYCINHFCDLPSQWSRTDYAAVASVFQKLPCSKASESLQQPLLLPLKQSEPVVYFWGSFTCWYFLQWTRVFFFYGSDRDTWAYLRSVRGRSDLDSLRAKGQDWDSLAVITVFTYLESPLKKIFEMAPAPFCWSVSAFSHHDFFSLPFYFS